MRSMLLLFHNYSKRQLSYFTLPYKSGNFYQLSFDLFKTQQKVVFTTTI